MEKMMWTKPMAVAEQFMPNEYIAACYEIACSIGAAAPIGDEGKKDECCGHSHTRTSGGSGCGWAKNQNIQVSGPINNATIRIVEIGNDTYGTLQCEFTDAGGNSLGYSLTNVDLTTNPTVYWRTDVGYIWTTWMHHTGTFTLQDSSHPNRS